MEIAYFLGCIMNNRYPGVEKATRKLFEALDIELKDMEVHLVVLLLVYSVLLMKKPGLLLQHVT